MLHHALPIVPSWQWRAPSQAQPKDCFGNENRTRFRLTARLNDGFIKWRGWFESREDADAFLWALVRCVTLGEPIPRPLWELPTPAWHPWIGPDVGYDFATVTFLTTTGSVLTYTSPSDWNNSSNSIDCLSGGASGAVAEGSTNRHCTGGGGGAWSQVTNFSFAAPGTTTASYRVGVGGTAVDGTGSTVNPGVAGGDSFFDGTVLVGSTVGAQGASGGFGGSGSWNGGAGGASASGTGTTKKNGGRGGNLSGASGYGGSGGGGAAGSTANGANGNDSAGTGSALQTAGGAADVGGTGAGTGGALGGNNGGNGSEWDASHGSGGGGGGRSAVSGSGTGGNGGNYGGGGGGIVMLTAVSGAGIQGIVVISYTPTSTFTWFQMIDMPRAPSKSEMVGY